MVRVFPRSLISPNVVPPFKKKLEGFDVVRQRRSAAAPPRLEESVIVVEGEWKQPFAARS
jgi:hypothetical protein